MNNMYSKSYYFHILFGNKIYKDYIRQAINLPFNYDYDMKETYEKTNKILKGDLYMSILKYNSGYCQYNHKKSNGLELDDYEKKIYTDIEEAYNKVEPLSYPLRLFHGFELGLKYPKFEKNKEIKFDIILSKTPSWHVANFFARNNLWINRYMYVIYPEKSKHISIDVREKNNNEYEYLAINEKLTYLDKVYHITLWPLSLSIYYVFKY